MSNKEIDQIHDYDYNNDIEESDITRGDITSSYQQESTNSETLVSNKNEENSSSIFDNETTVNIIQENVVSSIDIEELKAQQNFLLGFTGGILASILCIFIWVVITVVTKYQISYMAIGVGFVVGFSIQKLGKGMTPIYGILGAILALFTCFAGNFISTIFLVANEFNYSYMEAFSSLDLDTSIIIIKESFQFMDLLFYGIAIYTGYICSIKSENEQN